MHVSHDMKVILQSLLCFILVLCIGLSIADKQVNTLTKQDALILSVVRNSDACYQFTLVGFHYQAQVLIPLGIVWSQGHTLFLDILSQKVALPTLFYLDVSSVFSKTYYEKLHGGFKYLLQLIYSK